jgi:multiple sugar transport system permease protein
MDATTARRGWWGRHARTQVPLFLLLCGFTAVNLTPVVWAVLTSFKQPVDAFAVPPTLVFTPTLTFHYQVWVEKAFWHYLLNSVVISVSTVVISVSIGTMAAYGLSRMRSNTSRGVLFAILSMRMFPHVLLAIPFFVLARMLGLINTYPAMILALVAINQPFTIWLMRSFFLDVPGELYEAAEIDGCSAWQVFTRVGLPLVRPGLWVTALFSLLLAYNEFLLGLVLTGPATKTLPVALAEYGAEDINYWTLSAAAAVGIMLPIVAFMMLLQRHLVRGLSMGAVKG